ncbi:MAG TPA: SDR family oxidoreductase [Thermoanaerobaculia bacterium]|nr:SDR family oxidoreductase [Thermoanaerobaculia bacterium]
MERSGKYFANRTALVTGGVRRLGLVIAERIAREGARVVITYFGSGRTEVRRAVRVLEEAGASEARAIRCDIADLTQVSKLVTTLTRKGQTVDFLVNSAANFLKEEFFEATPESFDASIALNVRGPFFLSQAAAPGMKRNGFGRIVNIADVAGVIPWPAYLAHSISKAGLIAMTRGLAKALAPEVLVNAVAPGPVMLPDGFNSTETRHAIEPTILKRPGSPEEVAEAVVFLLRSDYITGITLPVDGGRLIR